MVQYKLYYWNVFGRGEPIEMLFNYAGQPFEYVRIKLEEWPAHKPKFIFGQVPVLEVDGKQLAQSQAILAYLGKKFGLAGKDDWEQAKAVEASAYLEDIGKDLSPYLGVKFGYFPGDEDKLRKEYLPMVAGKHFPNLEKMLAQSGSGFILPSGISYADFRIVSFIDMIKPVEVQAKYPKLMEYVDRVNGLPQLREYMSKRKL